MIHRAGSDRVRKRREKQTRENMDLKMHIKSRQMAEKEQREGRRAQCRSRERRHSPGTGEAAHRKR